MAAYAKAAERKPLMRVVLLSDTHGFVEPFIQTLARSADWVVHAGDIGGWEVIEAKTPDRGKLVAVRGNNDWPKSWPGAAKSGAQDLGESAEVDLPGGLLAVEHGHRIWDTRHYHKRLRAKYPKARAIAYGHTHIRCADLDQAPWVLNPGAAGRERTKGGASCILLELSQQEWKVSEYRNGEISASDCRRA